MSANTASAARSVIKIHGGNDRALYYFEVSSNDLSRRGNTESSDDIFGNNSQASGYIANYNTDSYTFSGTLLYFSTDNPLTVDIDNGFGSRYRPKGTIEVIGRNSGGLYREIKMTGSISRGSNLENNDRKISGKKAQGYIVTGSDFWNAQGDITYLDLEPDYNSSIYVQYHRG
ncbi:MAG TPA: hypothetical protein VFJ06_04190 [Halococcus sp.]|nr:hypothetical protein [Halococcus sp.]